MAPIQQEPEIQLAQRLASNEKLIRTKAIKKLRKYITVRSQRIKGGFSGDELLKLWKGLFYCLWMQDKPLLQEELSNQIAGFLHNFQSVDSQFQYLETFLQTIKREWTGIDRLRMDKFYQLVRLVFRQTFEMLKKKGWETSILARFLELLTAQVLQSTSGAPCGLLFHIMDLYMTELAGVGSAELTAEQNLTFIKPFCKSAAKTKDRILLRAICNSIFSVIVDQAPFAIEDLMKEMKNAQTEDSDSGQASEEEEENVKTKHTVKKHSKKSSVKSTNDDQEEEKLFNLEDGLDIKLPDDEGIGPVLQFDYGALADELFQLASRNNTPSFNRQKLYKVIKMLRDLSEGAFPQDEYPEEVSTDEEDDEMFGSRKRMKREIGLGDKEEENAVKKLKGRTKNKSEHSDKGKPIDAKSDATRMKKKNKEKEKGQHAKEHTQEVEESEVKASEDSVLLASSGSQRTSDKDVKKVVPLLSSTEKKTETTALSEARETDTTMDNQSETPLATTILPQNCLTFTEAAEGNQKDQSEIKAIIEEPLNKFETVFVATASSKIRRKKASDPKVEEPSVEVAEAVEGQSGTQEESITCAAEPQTVTQTPIANIPGGKKCRWKSNKQQESEETTTEREESLEPELQSTPTNTEEPQTEAAPLKTRKRARKQNVVTQEESAETHITPAETSGDLDRTHTEETTVNAVHLKKRKRVSKANYQVADEDGETPPESETTCPRGWITATTTVKNTQKHQSTIQEREIKDQDQPDVDKGCDGEVPAENELLVTLKKVKKRKTSVMIEVAKELEAVGEEAAHLRTQPEVEPGDKKPKLNNDGQEPTTTINTKKLQKTLKDKADFIIFQNNATIPTPLFYKTASGGSRTDSASKKKCQIPKSESKKVTFGLKNNKTAEFRKNDRSLLLSPEGTSRVPFDPEQKPLFGVLKSPALSFTGSTKSTPNGRPTAADFF